MNGGVILSTKITREKKNSYSSIRQLFDGKQVILSFYAFVPVCLKAPANVTN